MKTREYVVQGDYGYGHGWEDLTCEPNRSEAKVRLKEYKENEPQYRHRLVTRVSK